MRRSQIALEFALRCNRSCDSQIGIARIDPDPSRRPVSSYTDPPHS